MNDKTPLIQKSENAAEGVELRTKDNNTVIAFTK